MGGCGRVGEATEVSGLSIGGKAEVPFGVAPIMLEVTACRELGDAGPVWRVGGLSEPAG